MSMRNIVINRPAKIFAMLGIALAGCQAPPTEVRAVDLSDYVDVLDYRFRSCDENAAQCSLFVDSGAWHAYALPEDSGRLGFPGPYLLTRDFGYWLGDRFGDLSVVNLDRGERLRLEDARIRAWAEPGRLNQEVVWPEVSLKQTLIFPDARSGLLEVSVLNRSSSSMSLQLEMESRRSSGTLTLVRRADEPAVVTRFEDSDAIVQLAWDLPGDARVGRAENGAYRVSTDVTVDAEEQVALYFSESSYLDEEDRASFEASIANSRLTHSAALVENRSRWATYIERVFERAPATNTDPRFEWLAVKSVLTLISNWRGAAKDLHYDGMYPSYAINDFNGVWSWDTWKQAVATAFFDADLAANQIRGMFCYQNEAGMVADVIYYDRSENNWRDTKPPLASWAVWETYRAGGDIDFLRELYPKLVKYHQWWYRFRDHDADGLAEYGSTDGTKIAAAWESGMDNAIRFDESVMLQNAEHAWSLNQESVDLNSYLYAEKRILANIARELGLASEAAVYDGEAETLKAQIRTQMFDTSSGYFYDLLIDGSEFVLVQGPEGWAPLWTGVATTEQALAVARVMLDENKFATTMPFPTVAADHPSFQPIGGYWRGPVWLDQAYFGTLALHRAGLADEAQGLRKRLVFNASGLLDQKPIYENYVPTTGQGIEAPHFSWSAAHYLMLLADYDLEEAEAN